MLFLLKIYKEVKTLELHGAVVTLEKGVSSKNGGNFTYYYADIKLNDAVVRCFIKENDYKLLSIYNLKPSK